MMIGIVVIAAFVMASSPADRQSLDRPQIQSQPAEVTAPPLFQGSKSLYASIFPESGARQEQLRAAPPATAETRPQPRIVCGMVLIPADPRIDPKIAWGDRGAKAVNPDPKIAWPVRQCADK